ncbi:MAG: hypothetical protein ACM3N6_18295 [Betaproteobacteria bacterium]
MNLGLTVRLRVAWLLAALLLCAPLAASAQVRLQLVAARDHIEGSFVGNQAVYADKDRIYLASFEGKLFVLARDRSANFPLVETVQVSSAPLTAVRGDGKLLYVSAMDGQLRVYRKDPTLQLAWAATLSDTGLSSLALQGREVYVARGQANLAADEGHVYLNELNEGDTALELDGTDFGVDLVYGQAFVTGTGIYNRANGKPVGVLPAAAGRNIYVDRKLLALSTPGCCGSGIALFDPETLAALQTVPRTSTNTALRNGRWLVGGTEAGTVDVFDLGRSPSPLVSSVDLRQATGHTGADDIEIRALWSDSNDMLVFAASSWGNQFTKSPTLPSFFVLELVPRQK